MPNPQSAAKAGRKQPAPSRASAQADVNASDWTALAVILSERPRDAVYHELCERFNSGERSDELAKAIAS
jgi:hypothetical protein